MQGDYNGMNSTMNSSNLNHSERSKHTSIGEQNFNQQQYREQQIQQIQQLQNKAVDPARARWRILREALMGQLVGPRDQDASIHRFPGFQMLKPKMVTKEKDEEDEEHKAVLASQAYNDLQEFQETLRLISISNEDMELFHKERKKAGSIHAATKNKTFLDRVVETIIIRASALFHYEFGSKAQNRKRRYPKSLPRHIEISLACGFDHVPDLICMTENLMEHDLCVFVANSFTSVNGGKEVKVDIHVPLCTIIRNEPTSTMFNCMEYHISLPFPSPMQNKKIMLASSAHGPINNPLWIRIRERDNNVQPGTGRVKVDLKALTSQRHYGVDNTGNTRIWDSEGTLAYCLFSPQTLPPMLGLQEIFSLAKPLSQAVRRNHTGPRYKSALNVVELGAGMAGIAGLALAAIDLSDQSEQIKMNVVITDGHPDAVLSNQINAAMTHSLYCHHKKQKGPRTTNPIIMNMHSKKLLWTDKIEGAHDCEMLRKMTIPFYNKENKNDPLNRFQLCLVSDCVHFQEFHSALIATIARLLSIGGVCILCQPPRGKSLGNFLSLLQSLNESSATKRNKFISKKNHLFQIHSQDFHPTLWELHEKYKQEMPKMYDPDVHFPRMIILKKLREYDEVTDGELIAELMRERES